MEEGSCISSLICCLGGLKVCTRVTEGETGKVNRGSDKPQAASVPWNSSLGQKKWKEGDTKWDCAQEINLAPGPSDAGLFPVKACLGPHGH